MSSACLSELRHGTAVDLAGGVLIIGPSGSGKSALALHLIALGARLISDDQVRLLAQDGRVHLRPAPHISGQIEARGIGILPAPSSDGAPLHLVVDLGAPPPARLPEPEELFVLGHPIPLIKGGGIGHLAPAILLLQTRGAPDAEP